MRRLALQGPTTPRVEEPTKELLHEFLLQAEEAEWNRGSGDAGLWWEEEGLEISLVLMLAAPGFVVRYDSNQEEDDFFLSHSALKPGEGTVFPGGNAWILGAQHFVPLNVTWTAVEHFYGTGRRCKPPEGFVWMEGINITASGDDC